MERKPQSLRLGLEEHAIVAIEMAAGNVQFSEAARRLIRRGGAAPEPVYLKAMLTCKEELDQYADEQERNRLLWTDIGSLLRAKLPADADEETKKLVATAKERARDFLAEALKLGATARWLAKKMQGISLEELAELRHCKEYLSSVVTRNKKLIEQGDPGALKPDILQSLERVLTVLKGLGI